MYLSQKTVKTSEDRKYWKWKKNYGIIEYMYWNWVILQDDVLISVAISPFAKGKVFSKAFSGKYVSNSAENSIGKYLSTCKFVSYVFQSTCENVFRKNTKTCNMINITLNHWNDSLRLEIKHCHRFVIVIYT